MSIMKIIHSDVEIDRLLRFVLLHVARCPSVWAVRLYNVRVVCMAVHCRLVCVSATVHCACGVRIVMDASLAGLGAAIGSRWS